MPAAAGREAATPATPTQTEEHRLLHAARGLLADGADHTVLVADFSGLAHIDDPTLWRAVAQAIRDRLGGDVADSFTLMHHRVALAMAGHAGEESSQRLRELADFLAGHGHGRLSWQIYELPRDGEAFLDFCRALRDDGAVAPPPDADTEAAEDLEDLIDLEDMLATADLSNLVRERAVWSFADPAQPVLLERELLTSVPDLSVVAGIDVRRTPWLFEQVLSILDRRMMSHILQEPGHQHGRFAINLHAASVLSNDFMSFIAGLPVGDSGNFSVELSHTDVMLHPKDTAQALERLASLEIRATLDAIPATALADLAPPTGITGLLKIDWDEAMAGEDIGALAARLAALDPGRCVLMHVDMPARFEAGRRLGFVNLEGRAAEDEAQAALAGREMAEPPPTIEAEARAAEAATAAQAPPPPKGLLASLRARLFGDGSGS